LFQKKFEIEMAALTDDLNRIYDAHQALLRLKERAGEDLESFEAIIASVKGSFPAKKMAAQSIPKFFAFFPSLQEQALNAQLDCCEDDDDSVRKYVF
jgi:hypothetical protein